MPLTPAWFTSTFESYFAEDLDWIRDLPPHTELIDGKLFFRSSQDLFHFLAMNAIRSAVERAAPSHLFRPEPGGVVVDEAALGGIGRPGDFAVADTLLVVEAVASESTTRDGEGRRGCYAVAGIPHLWLVGDTNGKTVIEVWKLNQERGSYDLDGEFTDCLKAEDPFPVALNLWDINELRC